MQNRRDIGGIQHIWRTRPSSICGNYCITSNPKVWSRQILRFGISLLLVIILIIAISGGATASETAPDCGEITYDGSGSSFSPYEISNIEELQCIGDEDTNSELSDEFVIVEDIEAGVTGDWNEGDGFAPIGSDDAFLGVLDGSDYVISNLTISRSDQNMVGLFARIDDGEIRNLQLEGGSVSGSTNVGALVGFLDGTDSSSLAIHAISANVSVTGSSRVGGLVGFADNGPDITNVSSSGVVNGDSTTGGLVGSLWNFASVSESFADGAVFGNNDQIGGLVGHLAGYASVEKSYAHGSVEGESEVGGLIGSTDPFFTNPPSVDESYATGQVTGINDADDIGGLIGNKGIGEVDNSYWDEITTGQDDSDGGTALITDDMSGFDAMSTMDGFDFSTTWQVTASYPVLQSQPQTKFDPFLVFQTIETNNPADGTDLKATGTVENRGQETENEQISLAFDGNVENSTEIDIGEGSTKDVTLAHEIPTGTEHGSYLASMASPHDDILSSFEVIPNFAVRIDDINEPAYGNELIVDATIEKQGDAKTDQTISLYFDGGEVATTTTNIDEVGGQESVELTYSLPEDTTPGTYELNVTSVDDSDEGQVDVMKNMVVSIAESPDAMLGEELEIVADVTKFGDLYDDQTISFEFDSSIVDSTVTDLAVGESEIVTLNHTIPEEIEPGEYPVNVTSVDDYSVADIEVIGHISLNGTVKEMVTNNPIPDATVSVENEDGTSISTTSNESGWYSLDILPDQTVNINVTSTGYQMYEETLTIPEVGLTHSPTMYVTLPGSGVPDDPYRIETPMHLQAVNANLTADYVLSNDINSSETSEWHLYQYHSESLGFSWSGNDPGDQFDLQYGIDEVIESIDADDGSEVEVTIVDQENGIIELQEQTEGQLEITFSLLEPFAQGFEPIGNEAEMSHFIGSFDGQGYEISNLMINRELRDYTGLFGVLGEGSEVSNLGIHSESIDGRDYVGGLAGATLGTVENSHTSGQIQGSETVGGLIGVHGDLTGGGGSTPFVYTWDGEKYQFDDELGRSPQWSDSPMDWAQIDSDRLEPSDGKYNISITQEYNEISYLDRIQLQTFDHEPGYTVVTSTIRSNQGEPKVVSADPSQPTACEDSYGNDCLDAISDRDGNWTKLGAKEDNYYNPIELDLGDLSGTDNIRLVLQGTADFNLDLHPTNFERTIQVPDSEGNWVNAYPESEIRRPQATPRLVAINMSGVFETDDYRVRLGADRSRWNFVGVDTSEPDDVITETHHPQIADLQYRGFSEVDKESKPYWDFDYQTVRDTPNELFAYQSGNFTRYGDVSPLLQEKDDRFAILRYGDEVQLEFESTEVEEGLERSYLLEGAVWYKHADDATGRSVDPLPFNEMSEYPYEESESYPETPENEQYLEEWNTREYEPRSNGDNTVLNSHSHADVLGAGTVGGLVGLNDDLDIRRSFATGEVTSEGGNFAGGLIGHMAGDGDIHASVALGDVNGSVPLGGLIGLSDANNGNVTNSYASGSVSGNDFLGGLIGANPDGMVAESYAVGSISEGESVEVVESDDIGGLLGSDGSGFVVGSHWDVETTGQDDSGGAEVGLTTNQMQGPAAIDNMDFTFDEPWLATDEYPHLWWEVTDYSLTVSDTTIEPGDTTGSDVLVSLVADRQVGASSTSAYSSSDSDVLTIDDDGTVTAVSGGTADVQAQLGSYSDSVTIEVEEEEEPEEPVPEPAPEPAEAHFDVTITDTNSPLDPGETAVIDAEITNAGDGTGTQTIEFNVSDQIANESITIAPGNTELVSFEWETTTDDIGSHTATVASEDDVANTPISVTADHPTFVSAHVADATPAIVDITFDQAVSVDEDAPTYGFAVSLDGSPVDLETASADGTNVALELAQDVDANQDILLSYDGNSDNVVNEYDLEALAFETGDVDNQVEPLQANLTAIDPTTNDVADNISVDVTVEDGVIFSAEDSLVPPGQEATYEWQVGDRSFTTTDPELVDELLEPGTYEASVTVLVGDRSDIAEFTLTVVDDTPPDVRLTATETVDVGEDPNLDASESSDNVAIAEFEWDFDDGTTDSGANLTQPEHSFDEPGEYEVTVTVTDTSGNSAQNSTTITVEEEPDEGMDVLPIGLALLVVAALGVAGYWYMRRR